MKNYIYLFVFAILAATTGCDDWLDVNPETEIQADEMFSDETGFQDALTGIYVKLTSESLYGSRLTWKTMENLSYVYSLSGQSAEKRMQAHMYEDNLVVPIIEDIWLNEYNVIANINSLLHNLKLHGDVLNPTMHNIIKGEALALRAYCHFDLMRMYCKGGLADRPELMEELAIPYVMEYSKQVTPQLSYRETFNLIEKDIDDALELLKADPFYDKEIERPDNYDDVAYSSFVSGAYPRGREVKMNYVAVKALKSRVLLWEGDYERALEASEDAIAAIKYNIEEESNFSWATESYYDADKDLCLYSEHLFTLDVHLLKDILEDAYSRYNGGSVNYERRKIRRSTAEQIYSIGDGEGLSDIRYTRQLEDIGWQGYLTIKLRRYKENSSGFPYNTIPLLKMSEVYLNAAECYVKLGNTDKAIEYLNLLKEKRNIQPSYYLDSDDDLSEAITLEYRKEFIQEGQLFFFYKRLNLQNIPGLGKDLTDEEYAFPYPDIEIDLGNRN